MHSRVRRVNVRALLLLKSQENMINDCDFAGEDVRGKRNERSSTHCGSWLFSERTLSQFPTLCRMIFDSATAVFTNLRVRWEITEK